MIYLEDIAIEVKTKKYEKIRNITCGILLFFVFLSACNIVGTCMLNSEKIEKNLITIAEYKNKINAKQKEMDEYEKEVVNAYYDVTELGDSVAQIQSQYGGFNESISIADISQCAKETATEMDQYLYSGEGRSAWYQNMTCNYQWYYLMRQTSTVERIPCIWVCKSNANTILAVTTAVCNATEQKFSEFKTYYTTQGNALISTDTVINVSGVVEANIDYKEYYDNIKKIQEKVSSNVEAEITGNIDITINEVGE